MRILQVIPYFLPAYAFGGPLQMAYQVSRELVKRGHEVVVYTSDARDLNSRLDVDSVSVIEGIKVYYLRNFSFMFAKNLKLLVTPQLVSITREHLKKFDVVHLHEFRTFQNIVVHRYARKYIVPYVLQAHGSLPRIMAWQRLKWIYDVLFGYRLLKDASKVVALSQVRSPAVQGYGRA